MFFYILTIACFLELRVHYFSNKTDKQDVSFLIDLEKGLDDQNITRLYQCIYDIGTEKSNQSKEYNIIAGHNYQMYLTSRQDWYYTYYFNIIEDCFKKNKTKHTSILYFTVNGKLIDEYKLQMIKLCFYISIIKKNNWVLNDVVNNLIEVKEQKGTKDCKTLEKKKQHYLDIVKSITYLQLSEKLKGLEHLPFFNLVKYIIKTLFLEKSVTDDEITDFNLLKEDNFFEYLYDIFEMIDVKFLDDLVERITTKTEWDFLNKLR